MFHNLRRVAAAEGLQFGLKLSNTLEVGNWRARLGTDGMMYLSGRALHPVTTNLAAMLSEEFRGDVMLSFAGGADCFNVADLMAAGMTTVTVCSDLLKTGGYLRLAQYTENLAMAMDEADAADLADFTARRAVGVNGFAEFAPVLHRSALTDSSLALDLDACASLGAALVAVAAAPLQTARAWAGDHGLDAARTDALAALVLKVLARLNLRRYADETRTDWRYQKGSFRTDHSKTSRELGLFDCIEAPCVDECPVDQNVPLYMNAVRDGDFAEAVRLTRTDNPLPSILGHVCDHLCETTCIRTHLDEPLAIRHMKRFIMEQEGPPLISLQRPARGAKVAVIGAGPAGLSAAQALAEAGFSVTILEAHEYPGGMVGGAIPEYRLPQASIAQDMAVLRGLGVEIRYGQTAGVDFTLTDLRANGYVAIFVAVGAQLAKRLGLPGEDAEGVIDALHFLRRVREGTPVSVGPRVGVIGAGDTAMDTVRSALRVGAAEASLIYRRTIDQMPADPEEIVACREEGVRIVELARPAAIHVEDGRLAGLVCTRTEYGGDRDTAGRKIPVDVPGSEFEIELDTLVLAISQHSVLEFFGDEMPQLTRAGYISVDPLTFETSIAGVYAGGDVAGDGPSSIVRAAADGKAVARAIAQALGGEMAEVLATTPDPVDLAAMVQRRAHREYRVPVEHTPLEDRGGFLPTVSGYTVEQAQAEAGRCLDCHRICSLCVGVCPNMALLTYASEPISLSLPGLDVEDGAMVVGEPEVYRAEQALQIAVLTDFCNECGNCVTACPTSGAPYRDKPRLYLDRADFEAQRDNAFMLFDDGSIEGRYAGQTHRLWVNGSVEYASPEVQARLDRASLELLEAAPVAGAADGKKLSLRAVADMYVLLQGLAGSMQALPRAPREATRGTRIGHPGYDA
jgi:putative selenate reductase